MSLANRLYDRPWLDQWLALTGMYVSGILPMAAVSSAYEGRLQIHGSVGHCRAELINGTLPPGYSLNIDEATHEVIVAWPAYVSGDSSYDGDFEDGVGKGWRLGEGWSITDQASAYSGSYSAQWSGYGTASIDTDIMPCAPGKPVHLAAQIQQGASDKGAVGMQVVAEFLDAQRHVIGFEVGNLVTSGAGGEWHPSGLDTISPAGVVSIRGRVNAYRNRQNHPAWCDAVEFTWNAGQLGTNVAGVSTITIRVHDAAGRFADWTGLVQIGYIVLTSAPYPLESSVDKTAWALSPGGVTIHTGIVRTTQPAEKTAWSMVPGALTIRSSTQNYTAQERSTWSLTPGAVTVTTTVQRYTQPPESATWSLSPGTVTIDTVVIPYINPAEKSAWSMTPGTLTITTT